MTPTAYWPLKFKLDPPPLGSTTADGRSSLIFSAQRTPRKMERKHSPSMSISVYERNRSQVVRFAYTFFGPYFPVACRKTKYPFDETKKNGTTLSKKRKRGREETATPYETRDAHTVYLHISEGFLLATLLLVHQRALLLSNATLAVPVLGVGRRHSNSDADPVVSLRSSHAINSISSTD